jgi:hypothetical protein
MNIGNGIGKFPDVENFYLPEGGDMSNKTVDSGTDINMPYRLIFKYQTGDEQILMEIMPRGHAAFIIGVIKTGIQCAQREIRLILTGLFFYFPIVFKKMRHPPEVNQQGSSFDEYAKLH